MQKNKDSPSKSDGQDGEENIQNLMYYNLHSNFKNSEVLEEHRKQCEAEGKYVGKFNSIRNRIRMGIPNLNIFKISILLNIE